MSVLASTTNESISTALQKGDLEILWWIWRRSYGIAWIYLLVLLSIVISYALRGCWRLFRLISFRAESSVLPAQVFYAHFLYNSIGWLIASLWRKSCMPFRKNQFPPQPTHRLSMDIFFSFSLNQIFLKLGIMIFWNTAWKSAVCIFKGTQSDHPGMKQMESWGSKNS